MASAPHPRNAHPLDIDLAAESPSAAVQAHLAGCRVCRARLTAAGDPIDSRLDEPAAFQLSADSAQSRIPAALADRMAGYDYDATPQAGELWRAEFRGEVALVYVHRVDEREQLAHAMPVGEDVDYADAATVVVAYGPWGMPLGVWVDAERAVPLVVLDRPLAAFEHDVVEDVTAVRQWLRTGKPHDVSSVGAVITSDLDPRIAYRHALAQPLDSLATVLDPVDTPTEGASLANQLKAKGLKASAVAGALGWEPGDAVQLMRGSRMLGPDEAVRLADLLGTDPAMVTAVAPQPDIELLRAAHAPRRRRQIRDWAHRRALAEVVAREQAVAESMAMSRRDRAGGGDIDWDRLLDDFLVEHDG